MLQNKRIYGLYLKLNYNFVHDVLKKNWVRTKLVAGKLQVLNNRNLRRYENITRHQNENDKKTRKDDRMEEGNCWKIETPRTMLFLRGRGCNIPLIPRYFVNFECYCTCLRVRSSRPRTHWKETLQPV